MDEKIHFFSRCPSWRPALYILECFPINLLFFIASWFCCFGGTLTSHFNYWNKLFPQLRRMRRIFNILEWSETFEARPNTHLAWMSTTIENMENMLLPSKKREEDGEQKRKAIFCSQALHHPCSVGGLPSSFLLALIQPSSISWPVRKSSELSEIWEELSVRLEGSVLGGEHHWVSLEPERGGRRATPLSSMLAIARILHFILSANGSLRSILRKEWCNLI